MGDPILLTGSCFTDHMASQLRNYRYPVLENPNGILFNPFSIAHSLTSCMNARKYTTDDIFEQDGVWHSWQFHSRFSSTISQETIDRMNSSHGEAHQFLQDAKWIIITLGSAFVYQHPVAGIVANCHKVPTDRFQKRLLGQNEMLLELDEVFTKLFRFNSRLRIILTISPVRHLRDGFIENNQSKAALISAVHTLVHSHPSVHYFPAYELVMDDLRDYRYFAEDMVHPNYLATRYVWEKFVQTYMDDQTQELMKKINTINVARSHKPFQPNSTAHRRFMDQYLELSRQLQANHPSLDFSQDIKYFSSNG